MHTGLVDQWWTGGLVVDLLWCWFIQCSKSFSRFYSGDLPGLSFKSIRLSKYHQIQNSKLFPLCFDFDLNLKAHLSIYIRANPLPNSTCVFVYLYFHVFVYSCICVSKIFQQICQILNPVNPLPQFHVGSCAKCGRDSYRNIRIRNKTNTIYLLSSICQTLTQFCL